MKLKLTASAVALVSAFWALFSASCIPETAPVSASGATKVDVKIPKNEKGLTVEQDNVARRTLLESQPGSIKHLYVISAMSGQVIIYSTVKGKVTSSGKRLSPATARDSVGQPDFAVNVGGYTYYTEELLGDDGTYGSSVPYVYWFDSKGVYHQHYITGGQIFHVSDQPMAVKDIIINMEQQ